MPTETRRASCLEHEEDGTETGSQALLLRAHPREQNAESRRASLRPVP